MEQAIKAYHQEGNLRPSGSVEVQEGNLRPSGSVEVQITADSEFREAERLREMARHNEASALRHARDERTLEIARKMKNAGRPFNEITEFTGLTAEIIKGM